MAGLFPPEAGPLRIEGTHFYGQKLAQIRCISAFLLFLRYCRGEDITPELRWYRAFGFNTVRVFGPLPWVETPDYRLEDFDFDRFYSFLTLLEQHGLRCNFSIGHYPHAEWNAFARRIFEITGAHWNTVVEAVNEPHVGPKPDPVAMLKNVNRYGVLTSYGLYGSYYDKALQKQMKDALRALAAATTPAEKKQIKAQIAAIQAAIIPHPIADLGGVHIERDDAWHRKARHAQELQLLTGKPWWSDEPAKLTEPGFHYPGGKNDPNRTPAEVCWHAGVCYLWTSAFTFHCEEGKWGRVPQPGMLQHWCAEAVRDHVFLKIGPDVQTGEYNRGGNGDSPVDNVFTDQNQIWTYTSLHDHTAWSVRCGDIPLKAMNGWRIVDAWNGGTMAKLER